MSAIAQHGSSERRERRALRAPASVAPLVVGSVRDRFIPRDGEAAAFGAPAQQLLAHASKLPAQVTGGAAGLPRLAIAMIVQVVGERQQESLAVSGVVRMGWSGARHGASLPTGMSRNARAS
jgi:hypothetical protein